MRSMTATEASRNFGAVLDAVEQGETILLTRDGIPVGKVIPERASVAERLAEVFEKYPLDKDAGDDLARAVQEMREFMIDQEREWPVD